MNAEKNLLPGTYFGTCTNTTIQMEASLILVIKRQDGSEVSGDLTIHGNLKGGESEFSGVFNDGRLSFVTREIGQKFVITWTGIVSEGKIQGGYSVVDERFFSILFGHRIQKGVWQCQKEKN